MPKIDTLWIFLMWIVWFAFAMLSAVVITSLYGRKILAINTWVAAILSWIFWNALFDTAIFMDPTTWWMAMRVKIIIVPKSLQEWVLAAGSVAVYFVTVVLCINQTKAIEKN